MLFDGAKDCKVKRLKNMGRMRYKVKDIYIVLEVFKYELVSNMIAVAVDNK